MSWCSWLLLWLVTVMAGVAAIAGTIADCRRVLRRGGFVRLLCRDFTVERWASGAVTSAILSSILSSLKSRGLSYRREVG